MCCSVGEFYQQLAILPSNIKIIVKPWYIVLTCNRCFVLQPLMSVLLSIWGSSNNFLIHVKLMSHERTWMDSLNEYTVYWIGLNILERTVSIEYSEYYNYFLKSGERGADIVADISWEEKEVLMMNTFI